MHSRTGRVSEASGPIVVNEKSMHLNPSAVCGFGCGSRSEEVEMRVICLHHLSSVHFTAATSLGQRLALLVHYHEEIVAMMLPEGYNCLLPYEAGFVNPLSIRRKSTYVKCV